MRILYVTGAFPAESETFVARQIEGVRRAGHTVHVLAFSKDASSLEEILPGSGLFPEDITYTRPSGHLSRIERARTACAVLGGSRSSFSRLARVFFKGLRDRRFHYVNYLALAEALLGLPEFDVVHAQFGYLGRMVDAIRKTGICVRPLVVSFRGGDSTMFLRNNAGAYRELYSRAQHFCAVSGAFRELHIREGCPPGKISIIRSGLDCAAWNYRPRSPGRPVRLLFVGRLVPKKGADVAVEALAHLRSKGLDVRLDLVGDGPLRGELEAQTDRLGIRDRVHFAGWKSQTELMAFWDRSDVLVVPSRTARDGDQEGIPNVVKEAMASGLPVVASRHGGIPEMVIHGETGWLFEEGDAAGLAGQVAGLCTTGEVRRDVLDRARRLVVEEYDTDPITVRLLDIYREAIHPTSGGIFAA